MFSRNRIPHLLQINLRSQMFLCGSFEAFFSLATKYCLWGLDLDYLANLKPPLAYIVVNFPTESFPEPIANSFFFLRSVSKGFSVAYK